MLRITWQEKKSNEFVWRKVTEILGERPESVIETEKRRKLKFYGHQMRPGTMANILIEGKVEGTRKRGRQKRKWENDITEWRGEGLGQLKRQTTNRQGWKQSVHRWVHPRFA